MYPDYIWKMDTIDKKLYLTFDDGPCADSTLFILDCLASANAKATFFCLGKQVEIQPQLFKRIGDDGHQIGSHGYNHLSGWTTRTQQYLTDIHQAEEVFKSSLFRPPYGRIKKSQAKSILPNYKIVMWDVMPGDFDSTISNKQCLKNVISNSSSGSIIVLHDNQMAFPVLKEILPEILSHYTEQGYSFEKLT